MNVRIFTVALVLLSALVIWNYNSPERKALYEVQVQPKKELKNPRVAKSRLSAKVDLSEDTFPEQVSENIHRITNPHGDFVERTKDILALRKLKVSKADEDALLHHILTPHRDEVYTVKNDIIEHLVRYGSDQNKVGVGLLKIIQNESQSQVMREYVLQYVPEYYLSRWKAGTDWSELDEEDRQQFNQTMWQATDWQEGSMAGGALFALHKLASMYHDINADEVFEKSHKVLVDSSYANPNRMASVQILAFSGNEEYFDTARDIVLKKDGPILLQVTAVHTAVQSKQYHHQFNKYLKDITNGRVECDPTLKRCVLLTLNKLNNLGSE